MTAPLELVHDGLGDPDPLVGSNGDAHGARVSRRGRGGSVVVLHRHLDRERLDTRWPRRTRSASSSSAAARRRWRRRSSSPRASSPIAMRSPAATRLAPGRQVRERPGRQRAHRGARPARLVRLLRQRVRPDATLLRRARPRPCAIRLHLGRHRVRRADQGDPLATRRRRAGRRRRMVAPRAELPAHPVAPQRRRRGHRVGSARARVGAGEPRAGGRAARRQGPLRRADARRGAFGHRGERRGRGQAPRAPRQRDRRAGFVRPSTTTSPTSPS